MTWVEKMPLMLGESGKVWQQSCPWNFFSTYKLSHTARPPTSTPASVNFGKFAEHIQKCLLIIENVLES